MGWAEGADAGMARMLARQEGGRGGSEMSNTGHKSITRMTMRGREGYVVAVWDGRRKRMVRRFINLARYGEQEALAEAQRMRAHLERSLRKPSSERKVYSAPREPLRTVGPDGRPAYRVNYMDGHVQRSHYVYITTRGEEAAYAQACALLRQKARLYLAVPPQKASALGAGGERCPA